VAEWIARVYRDGPAYQVVVEGLLSFEMDGLEGIEGRTADEIAEHLRKFFLRRARAREDPSAEMVSEFDFAAGRSSRER
jgi:hypothetical protein